jgi:hypothetical protein
MSSYDLRAHMVALSAERLEARQAGLGHNATYMAELAVDLAAANAAYIGLAVTEIASLRGELSGPLVG